MRQCSVPAYYDGRNREMYEVVPKTIDVTMYGKRGRAHHVMDQKYCESSDGELAAV